jgi:hypothetical protein
MHVILHYHSLTALYTLTYEIFSEYVRICAKISAYSLNSKEKYLLYDEYDRVPATTPLNLMKY